MRILLTLLCAICWSASFGQSVFWQPASFNLADSANRSIIQSAPLQVWTNLDSTIDVVVKQFSSDRTTLGWERSLMTDQITYPPFTDMIWLQVESGDTSHLTFEYYPEGVSGCIEEKYLICWPDTQQCDTFFIEVCALATAGIHESPQVKVGPNPFDAWIGVDVQENVALRLLDMWGREVLHATHVKTLDTNEIPPGMYILVIQSEKDQWSYRTRVIKRSL